MAKEPKHLPTPAVPGNGPYHWGNGPKPEGLIARLIRKATGKK